jgi:hypothetical protein
MNLGTKENLLRFSFVSVFEPKSVDGGEPKYSVQVLVPKAHTKTVEQIKDAINKATELGVQKNLFTKAATKNPAFRWCLRDGDAEAAESADGNKDYLKGHFFFNASCNTKNPPAVVDKFLKPIINDQAFYSGCYGVINCNFFPFKHGKGGIACGLNSIMKRDDGDRLDGRVPVEEAFAELMDDPEDETVSGESGELV